MQSISFYLKNPKVVGNIILYRFCRWMPDKLYLMLKFRLWMGQWPNLKHPKSFNEKLQWLKLYNRKPEYTVMVDKVKVKDYVASVIGKEHIIPTLGVWDNPDMIDFDSLPNRFVLKCNHNSGLGMYICKDKSELNIDIVKEGLREGLKQDFYVGGREWPYKDVHRLILAEEFLEPNSDSKREGGLKDYKFFCFDGAVKALFIAKDRDKGPHSTKFDFFDENFNHLPFTNGHPNAEIMPEKPIMFEEMKMLAAKLSKGIPHVRIDFYEVDGLVYFGEMTFFHWSGFTPFVPEEWDYKFGEWLSLPQKSL